MLWINELLIRYTWLLKHIGYLRTYNINNMAQEEKTPKIPQKSKHKKDPKTNFFFKYVAIVLCTYIVMTTLV